jgi:hypothetical protein
MRTGAKPMAGSETTNAHGGIGVNLSTIQFALQLPPHRFEVATFATRIYQNFLVYSVCLIAAIYVCLLVFAPIQTFVLSVAVIFVGSIVILLLTPSRQRLHRLLEGGLAAGYIAGAAALLKAFEAFLHRM